MSQLSFLAGLGVCLAIVPHLLFARDEVGVSNYGVRAATVVPFTLGFLLCAAFLVLAARATPSQPAVLGRFRTALFTVSVLTVLVLASTYPYKIDVVLRDVHIVTGALFLSFELVLSVWLSADRPRHRTTRFLVALQSSGCALALLTLAGLLHLLLLAQLMASGAFGVLLVQTGPPLVNRVASPDHPVD